ncbi:hypothetical protein CDA63_07330 [Hymenobacter amundsenii]|uniref:CBM20 domain-containing protein n=1 Tax=Hymenobacter amundsenii TaxID=2006685 RepID=A0A246FM39_9BACT|nr:CBM20 domain-containing protein [Hymenobacter amundsenii]OWP63792.1 hypothetical protein CDA63_07330 [Hymenobacter amundsenii]
MILRFTLPFRTAWGQRLVVCGSLPSLGQWDPTQALSLHYHSDSGLWSQEISLPAGELASVEYKYLLLDERDGGRYWEWGPNRHVQAAAGSFTQIVLTDFWRAPALPENELYTAAFTEALLRRPAPMAAPAPAVAARPCVSSCRPRGSSRCTSSACWAPMPPSGPGMRPRPCRCRMPTTRPGPPK